jgi:hypothetical protein
MKIPLLILALLSPAISFADGVSACASVMSDAGLRDSQIRLNMNGGTRGVALATATGAFFEFASYEWAGRSLEAGAGLRWSFGKTVQLVAGASAIVAPLGGASGGGRALVGFTARWGDQFFVRPGAVASFALLGGDHPIRLQVPLVLSVEAGYTWPAASVYLRLAGGFDPIAGFKTSAFAEPSLGLALPFDIVAAPH